jgi:elongation factor P
MVSINDLTNTDTIIIDGAPYVVLSVKHQHVGRGSATVALKIKNIKTGQVLDRNYKSNEEFQEGEIEKIAVKFLYHHRNEYWFAESSNPKNRIELDETVLGDSKDYLKANLDVVALKFEGEIFNVELPIKVDYKVVEAPPAVRGNTSQGGTKIAVIESGAKVIVPLFVNEGDIIRVNTQTGEYYERAEKG